MILTTTSPPPRRRRSMRRCGGSRVRARARTAPLSRRPLLRGGGAGRGEVEEAPLLGLGMTGVVMMMRLRCRWCRRRRRRRGEEGGRRVKSSGSTGWTKRRRGGCRRGRTKRVGGRGEVGERYGVKRGAAVAAVAVLVIVLAVVAVVALVAVVVVVWMMGRVDERCRYPRPPRLTPRAMPAVNPGRRGARWSSNRRRRRCSTTQSRRRGGTTDPRRSRLCSSLYSTRGRSFRARRRFARVVGRAGGGWRGCAFSRRRRRWRPARGGGRGGGVVPVVVAGMVGMVAVMGVVMGVVGAGVEAVETILERWVALGGGRAGVERVVGGVGCIGRTMWRRRTSGRRRRCRVSSVSWSRRSGCMNRYDMGDEERERLRL